MGNAGRVGSYESPIYPLSYWLILKGGVFRDFPQCYYTYVSFCGA